MQCPLCGFEFDPTVARVCSRCPVQFGCTLICCPNCGYQMVDVEASRLGRWLERLLGKRPEGQGVDR
jgi:rubredoxin